MRVSILITAYRRAQLLEPTLRSIRCQLFNGEVIVVEDGYDGGLTEAVCHAHGAKWLCRRDRPDIPYSNQAVPMNMGIRAADGEVLILQNAECLHIGNVIAALTEAVEPDTTVFARCIALNQDGSEGTDYCSPQNPRPLFFCGAIRADRMIPLDEDFKGYGYEDDALAIRLRESGIRFVFHDATVHHQWHPSLWHGDSVGTEMELENRKLFRAKYLTRNSGQA